MECSTSFRIGILSTYNSCTMKTCLTFTSLLQGQNAHKYCYENLINAATPMAACLIIYNNLDSVWTTTGTSYVHLSTVSVVSMT